MFDELRKSLSSVSQPEKVAGMEAYMKHRFRFLGVPAPERKQASASFIKSFAEHPADDVLVNAELLFGQPEREFQYVACDLLRRWSKGFPADSLSRLQELVIRGAWWDTVDALAAHPIGTVVQRYGCQTVMDSWSEHSDMWVVRSAILHQLQYREKVDHERLFAYCRTHADGADFFIRKAIGWALRSFARFEPEKVREFVDATPLSELSRREALKHIG